MSTRACLASLISVPSGDWVKREESGDDISNNVQPLLLFQQSGIDISNGNTSNSDLSNIDLSVIDPILLEIDSKR